ncbi:hypothetical protein [Novilysobacter arseniciresistens]|uniref:hypothetical protein n=1 Tax=Novilysobacter arseniciresistens TaxID=1385522 RepID=UPI001269C8CF|nr:hypothetical protein [Lysobacter arseniciresistens]
MSRTGIKRGIGWALAVLVGVPALAYLALVVINRNDEPPSADVARLVALHQSGPALADAANGHVHARDLATGPGAVADYRAARSPAVTALAQACRQAATCAEALDAHPAVPAQWLDAEQWLLARYRRMLATEGWREEVPEDLAAQLPAYQPAMDAQQLHLLDARRLALAGEPAAVRDLLERDLLFWRQVLASSDLLVTKMIAAAAVRHHFALGTLALRALPAGEAAAAVPPSWRQPVTVAERSLARALAGEWQLIANSTRAWLSPAAVSDAGIGDRLLRPLYQEQATLNRGAARMVRLGALSELPYPELAPALAGLATPPEHAGPRLQVYNPVGAMLDPAAVEPAYGDYIARAGDLEGVRRAALLAADLRGQGVGPDAAAAALRAATLRGPYDGAPFKWDATSGSVVFDGLAHGERGRYAVPL